MPNANDGPIAGYPNTINSTSLSGSSMAGPLTFTNQAAAPANPTGASVMYSTGGVLTYINPQGLVQTIVGSQGGIQTAGITTVASTSSETVLQSFPLPAADAVAGSVYKMVGWGTFSDTGTPTLAWGLRLGGVAGTSLTTVQATTLGSSLTAAPFKYEILVNFLSATTVQPFFELDLGTSSTTGATTPYSGTPSGAVTVSLSTAKVLVTTVTFSAASASNTISLLGGWTERVA
jgi:hypothetical protein